MSSTLPPFYPLTPNNHAALVVIAAIISLIYAMLALGIKFFIRLNVTSIRDFDVLLFTGMVLYVVQTVCVIIACNHGLGQHRSAIMTSGFDIYSKASYASRLLAILIFGLAKLSICLLIRQISNHGWLRRVNQALFGLTTVWMVSGFLATAFQCPLPEPWLVEKCPALVPAYMYNSIMNILTDVALCILPIAMMLEVQTTTERKIVVIMLFGCRILIPAAAIPTLVHPEYLESVDSTWLSVPINVWCQIALALSIITACIPSLKSVIDSYLGGTGMATVQGPYELTRSGNDSGLAAIRVHDDSGQGGRSSGTDGKRSAVRGKVIVASREAGVVKTTREENESVEGLTTAREESDREVSSRGASQGHSRGSSVADYSG